MLSALKTYLKIRGHSSVCRAHEGFPSCVCWFEEADAELKALQEAVEAARIIYDVSRIYQNKTPCPHGNYPSYPTHAWWCDDCFNRLGNALKVLK